MGTRSTTRIYKITKIGLDDKKELYLSLYKQYDGYPDGWGTEIKTFFKSGKLVNGFSMNESIKQFNGVGCFALQLVCEFKEGVGGLYSTTESDEQEFNYIINFKYIRKDYKEKCTCVEFICLEDSQYNEIIYLDKEF